MTTRFGWKAVTTVAVAAAAICLGGCTKDKHAAHAKEQKIEMADVPPAVRQTLAAESHGATASKVEKEMKDGQTVYETDVMLSGKNYELKIAEDGTLLSKKLDM